MAPLSALQADWLVLSPLLDDALSLPAAERAGWLAALAADDAIKTALAGLLDLPGGGMETGDFLRTLHKLDGPGSTALEPAASAGSGAQQAGEQVGPWRLLRLLGEGGMGCVWLAERADGAYQRQVALKLPRMSWARGLVERMARERDILATLEHPHIARLYDAGVDAQGRPWLALEHVRGRPIDEHARRLGLGVKQRLQLLLQVCEAVAFAHSRLVIHRDLKPSNILVTEAGQVTLLDFGIAKLVQESAGAGAEATALTQMQGRALTLDYASPEQVCGTVLTTASDVYSLGVVAYELLVGCRPYRLKRGSPAELEEAIAEADVPLASTVAAPGDRKALRGDLDAILNRALKKNLAERTPSAEAIAQDVERHLRGEPVHARPDSRRYRLGRFMYRHRVGMAAGTALALAITAGSAVATWQAVVAREEAVRARAEVQRQEAVRNLFIDAMTRFAVLAKDDPLALGKPGALNAVLLEELQGYERRYASLPGALQAQYEAVAIHLNYANDFEGSLQVGQRYLSHLKQHGAEPAVVINAYNMMGRTLFQLRRLDESEAMRRAGVAWAPQATDARTERTRLRLALDLGSLLSSRGRRAEAEAVLRGADTVSSQRFEQSLLRAEVLRALAGFYNGFDDPRALDFAQRAHAALVSDGTGSDDDVETTVYVLGGALQAAGHAAEAVPWLRQSLELTLKLNGKLDRNTVRASGRLSSAMARMGDHVGARALLQQLLAEHSALGTDATTSNSLTLKARALENEWLYGDAAAAAALVASDPAAYLRLLARRGADLFIALEVRALLLAGRPGDALARAERLHRDWPSAGLPSASWLRILETLAAAQLGAGQPSAAQATAAKLLSILDSHDARSGWAWRVANEWAALACAHQGDFMLASQRLAQAQTVTTGAPSPVERAESALRQAEVLKLVGRLEDARERARTALPDLAMQHPSSPRLEQVRRWAGD